MPRRDGVLAKASLGFAIAAALAGLVLVYSSSSLMDDVHRFEGSSRAWAVAGMVLVLGLAALCFFESYRFFRFFRSDEVRQHYYTKSRLREIKRNQARRT